MSEREPSHIVLTDQEEIEERGWVLGEDAETPEEAVSIMERECPLDDDLLYFGSDGRREWLRPHPDPECFPSFQHCEPTDPGAAEWWVIEIWEREPVTPKPNHGEKR